MALLRRGQGVRRAGGCRNGKGKTRLPDLSRTGAGAYAEQRERIWRRQRAALLHLLQLLIDKNPFWQGRLRFAQLPKLERPEDIRQLPLLSKEELVQDQVDHPPYGTNLTYPNHHYVRLHQTSGTTRAVPLRFLDTRESWARFVDMWVGIYETVGVTQHDRLFFPFSFGPFIGFWGAFEAAQQIGAFVVTGGGMSSRARLSAILEHRITVLPATPTYALHLAQQAEELGVDLRSSAVRLLIVAGEPGGSVPEIRGQLEQHWNARVWDHWGMTEVGALGVECPVVRGRMHLNEEHCIAEVLDPDQGNPVRPGEEGELVITTLWRAGQPVVRYRTGDMVRLAPPEPCQCGSPYIGLEGGILGRRDHMLFIRGNNVYPAAIEALVRQVPGIAEFEGIVSRKGAMTELTVRIEPEPGHSEAADRIAQALQELIRDRLHFRATVLPVAPGTLPRWELKANRWKTAT